MDQRERVAKAIYESTPTSGRRGHWDELPADTREICFDVADAAIAAVNEWQPIATAPRHGNYARVSIEEGLLYCPLGGEATHWLPLPAPPEPT